MSYSKMADLRNLFLENNPNAQRGKSNIDRYKYHKHLFTLLRHHSEKEISPDETYLRDDVDYYLEYFSILSLGHLTGYLNLNELQEDRAEIIHYLTLPPLRKYYYDHYVLHLPQILLEALQRDNSLAHPSKDDLRNETSFLQFHALNQTIDNPEVNQFLWFLDNGWSDDYGLRHLKKALKDTRKCFKKRKRRDALGESIRGFFLYLDFLELFDVFLQNQTNDFSKSAYWMYHAYWFVRIRKHLKSAIEKFFNGVQEYVMENSEDRQAIELVDASRKTYLEILDRVVYNPDYQETFERNLREWRNHSG